MSEFNNITDLAQIAANGITVSDWTTFNSPVTKLNLKRNTTYYFNVVVKDEAQNMKEYTVTSATTKNAVYIFATTYQFTGNLGGRAGANAKCVTAYTDTYSYLGASNVHALVSVSGSDEIRDLPVPVNTTIRGPASDSGVITQNWDDLLVSGLDLSMIGSKVLTHILNYYWTGSNPDGSLDVGNNCNNWTIGDTTANGTTGDPNATGSPWLKNYVEKCGGGNTRRILCICW